MHLMIVVVPLPELTASWAQKRLAKPTGRIAFGI